MSIRFVACKLAIILINRPKQLPKGYQSLNRRFVSKYHTFSKLFALRNGFVSFRNVYCTYSHKLRIQYKLIASTAIKLIVNNYRLKSTFSQLFFSLSFLPPKIHVALLCSDLRVFCGCFCKQP